MRKTVYLSDMLLKLLKNNENSRVHQVRMNAYASPDLVGRACRVGDPTGTANKNKLSFN